MPAATDTKIQYTLRISKRSRRIRLLVLPGGKIVVSAPVNAKPSLIDGFVAEKSQWILSKVAIQKLRPVHDPKASRQEYLRMKEKALDKVMDRIAHFNKIYNFRYGRVAIKNSKTLWGSCSRKANLNFNYKAAMLPPEQCDYVIVHELCHLAVFNHSSEFWDLVSQTIPDHKRIRREIRSKGLGFS